MEVFITHTDTMDCYGAIQNNSIDLIILAQKDLQDIINKKTNVPIQFTHRANIYRALID